VNIIGLMQLLATWYGVVNGMVLHMNGVHGMKLLLGIVIAGVVALIIGMIKNTTIKLTLDHIMNPGTNFK